MNTGTGYTMIFLAVLSAAFFIRWGLLFYLFHIMPWRCKNNDWIWPWAFFLGAEICFALAAGAGIVSVMNGVDTLFGECVLFATGMFLRDWLRLGLVDDGLEEDFADKIFNPWGIAKI